MANLTLPLPDDLYAQLQGLATGQNRSIAEQAPELLKTAIAVELNRHAQSILLAEIGRARWTPPEAIPDSVTLLREIRGYDN